MSAPSEEKKYDAFITYRSGPDAAEAHALYDILTANRLKPAIDSRDFSPAETFLDEMARCVSESQYLIALISSRYATSHFTREEASMRQILDNQDKKRRLIVAYIEDCKAPLWMQSRVGVRLFQDKGKKDQPELKRLLKLLMLKGENPSPVEEQAIEQAINANWKNLPKQLFEFGIYATAGYGVLSAIADMNLDVAKDAALSGLKDSVSDQLQDHGHAVGDHMSDHAHGLLRGAGHVIKNIFDTFF